jgi:hypothetical protein
MSTVPGNNHWFDRNCDPTDAPQQQEQVASGGGNVGSPQGGPADSTVNQVIEDLIGQCYPSQAPTSIRNFIGDDAPKIPNEMNLDWSGIFQIIDGYGIPRPDTTKIRVNFPDVGEPGSGSICYDRGDGVLDCSVPKNPDFDACIKDHLDCMFKPYVGGAWKPPATDCDAFIPKQTFGTTNKICIANCVPERVPIYEHVLGGPEVGEDNATFSSNSTLSISAPSIVTIEFWWDDNPGTAGVAVNTVTIDGTTFTRNGTKGKSTETFNLDAGNYTISYTGLNSVGNHYVTNTYGNNKNIKFEDGHGTDQNARLTIVDSGVATNHLYSLDETPPSGYNATGKVFYGHPATAVQDATRSIPVYVSYSSAKIDTMLTTRPEAEQSTMDSYGMGARDETLFWAYDDTDDMISSLMDGEKAHALHRYFSPDKRDHLYTLQPLGGATLEPNLKKGRYRLVDKAQTYLNIAFEARKGNAGRENTFFWYVTNGLGGDPVYGEVIMPNITDASGKFIHKINKKLLNQYIPCDFGFGIVPDGNDENGNVDQGDVLSFSDTGNGWKCNLDSVESDNISFFSERRLNRDEKECTLWPNRRWQYWEDMFANSDEDYDDVKISYNLTYGNSAYHYEGVQCYVFDRPATPVYQDLKTSDCAQAVFDGAFADVEIIRTGCGNMSENETEGDGSGCGKCTGEYGYTLNKVQSVTATRDATLTLRTHGGMTGGRNDCCVFTYAIEINGNETMSERVHVKDWGIIGRVLQTFNVSKGDQVTFKIKNVNRGHYNSRTAPAVSLRDETQEEILNTWTINITTTSQGYNDQNPGQVDGRATEATEPCGLPVSGQLFATCNDTQEDLTTVLTNKVVQSNFLETRGDLNCDIEVIGGKLVKDMSTNQTGFLNTKGDGGVTLKLTYQILNPATYHIRWSLNEVLDYGRGGWETGDTFRLFIGSWTKIKKSSAKTYKDDPTIRNRKEKYYLGFKVTGINGLQCPDTNSDQGKIQDVKFFATSYAYRVDPILEPRRVINNRSITGNEFKINMNELFQSMFLYDAGVATSFDEYWLKESAAGREVAFYQDYRDVRGFKFRAKIRVQRIDHYADGDTYEYPKYGWFGNWSISQVDSYGKRYGENETLMIEFPPGRLQTTTGQETEAPYYPVQDNLPKDVLVTDRTTGRFKRNARWAIYQSSHDKNSNVWYSNQTSFKPSQKVYIETQITDVD